MSDILDFLEDGYQDYLDTISNEQFKKHSNEIIKRVFINGNEELYNYIDKRLSITLKKIKQIISIIFVGGYVIEKIKLSTIKLLEKKFPVLYKDFVNGKIENLCQLDILRSLSIDILEYIFKDKSVSINFINDKKTKSYIKSPTLFYSLDTYAWFIKGVGINFTLEEKYELIYNYYKSLNVMLLDDDENDKKVITLENFKKIQKILDFKNLELTNLLTYKTSNYLKEKKLCILIIKYSTLELIEYFFENIEPKKIINEDNIDEMINGCILRNNIKIFKYILGWMNILDLKIDESIIYELNNSLSKIIKKRDYSEDGINDDIIYEIIDLGVVPPINNKYYNYYKSIRITK